MAPRPALLLRPAALLLLLPAPSTPTSSPAPPPLRNTSLFPACVADGDCDRDRRCFQYMCYPWQTQTGFRWCSKPGDCTALLPEEGGLDGRDGACFRHSDQKQINFGICLRRSEMKKCRSHSDCPGGAAPVERRGALRCTNGWCGDPAYLSALGERECQRDQECETLLTGDMCCLDFSSPTAWGPGRDGRWRKRCCSNPSGRSVIRPPDSISPHQLALLDKRIRELALLFMDMVVCEALKYRMMLQLPSCTEYLTTPPPPPDPHHLSAAPGPGPALALPCCLALLLLAGAGRAQ